MERQGLAGLPEFTAPLRVGVSPLTENDQSIRMNAPALATVVIVAAALILIVLERLAPYEPRQRLFRPGLWTDLFWYTVVQNWVLGYVIGAIIARLDALAHGRMHLLTRWPLAAQAIFFLLLHDLYIYWFHRWQHHSPLLWRVHEAHHSTADVDWLSGSR